MAQPVQLSKIEAVLMVRLQHFEQHTHNRLVFTEGVVCQPRLAGAGEANNTTLHRATRMDSGGSRLPVLRRLLCFISSIDAKMSRSCPPLSRNLAQLLPMSTTSGPPLAPHPRLSLSYHLFSTVTVVAWSIFITATLIILELAHRATWNYSRVADNEALPWAFSVLPGILRTIFDQGHGPITAMHLARLAVGSLDTSWTSANTWMEVFWLADRRWSGPVGLWTIFEAMFSLSWHSLHVPRVSFGFWLFAALSIVTLVTPLALSRAYHGTTADIRRQTTVSSVFMMDIGEVFDPLATSVSELQNLQIPYGIPIWGRGVSPTVQFRDTMYAANDERPTPSSGDWFISGNARRASMQLVGLRVAGGCEYFQANDITFESVCAATFGDDPRFIGEPSTNSFLHYANKNPRDTSEVRRL